MQQHTLTLPPSPALFLITGIMAAGKSTVAQHLAERGERSVHLRGDLFRRMIVRGQAPMDFVLSPEATAQLHLRYTIAASVARQYLDAGYTVVYQDIIIGPDLQDVLHDLMRPGIPVYVVVLCPRPDIVAVRDDERPKNGYGASSVLDFDRVLRDETPRVGLWLDSSDLAVEQTVDTILQRLDEARITSPD
jgi:adenylylsulfate kinase-like enzyme